MKNCVIIFLLLLSKLLQNLGSKNVHFVKLASIKVPYVNTKFIDFEADVSPFNESVNCLNETFKLKFLADDNIFADVWTYRMTKTNRSFLFSRFSVNWKDIITSEKLGMDSLWREHTHPPLFWPPRVNVVYHLYGWAPDSSHIPNTIPVGDIKILVGLMLPNRTKLYDMEWILRFS